MARHYKRRMKLKLKKNTVYTIAAVMLLGTSGIIGLSFFQHGTMLGRIRDELVNYLGWSALLLPFLFLSFAALLLGFKSRWTAPNIPIGFSLIFGSIIGISQSGVVGYTLWRYLEDLISGPGAAI